MGDERPAVVVEDRWRSQTKSGGGAAPPEERGDCVPVCMEGILGLPAGTLPNTHGEGWWQRLQEALAPHGYGVQFMDLRWDPADIYWIASVPSLNLPPDPNGKPALHCLVVKGREFVHDPAIGDRYDAAKWAEAWNEDKVAEGWALVELDPALSRAEAAERERDELREALRMIDRRLTTLEGDNVPRGTAAALTAREIARAALSGGATREEGATGDTLDR